MNTVKPILLGTALLALAGLCNQPARADANYTATVSGITPQGGDYPVVFGYQGSNPTPADIPVKVAQMSVQVTGAAPSSTIYVGWSMSIKYTVRTTSGSYAGSTFDTDASNGMAPEKTLPDGSWKHNWKGAPDSTTTPPAPALSETITTTQVGSWVVEADSSITDTHGTNMPAAPVTGKFTTSHANIV